MPLRSSVAVAGAAASHDRRRRSSRACRCGPVVVGACRGRRRASCWWCVVAVELVVVDAGRSWSWSCSRPRSSWSSWSSRSFRSSPVEPPVEEDGWHWRSAAVRRTMKPVPQLDRQPSVDARRHVRRSRSWRSRSPARVTEQSLGRDARLDVGQIVVERAGGRRRGSGRRCLSRRRRRPAPSRSPRRAIAGALIARTPGARPASRAGAPRGSRRPLPAMS